MYSKEKIEKIRQEINTRKGMSKKEKLAYLDFFKRMETRFNLSEGDITDDSSVQEITRRHHEINFQISRKYQMIESLIGIMQADRRWSKVEYFNENTFTERIIVEYSFDKLGQILEDFTEHDKDVFYLLDTPLAA